MEGKEGEGEEEVELEVDEFDSRMACHVLARWRVTAITIHCREIQMLA